MLSIIVAIASLPFRPFASRIRSNVAPVARECADWSAVAAGFSGLAVVAGLLASNWTFAAVAAGSFVAFGLTARVARRFA